MPDPQTLNAKDSAVFVGYSQRHWAVLVSAGQTPKPLQIGKWPRWSIDELRAWLAAGAPPRDVWQKLKAGKELSTT